MEEKKLQMARVQVDQGSISITFGRFNPPTIGHERLIDKVAKEAKSSGGEYRIYPLKVAGS